MYKDDEIIEHTSDSINIEDKAFTDMNNISYSSTRFDNTNIDIENNDAKDDAHAMPIMPFTRVDEINCNESLSMMRSKSDCNNDNVFDGGSNESSKSDDEENNATNEQPESAFQIVQRSMNNTSRNNTSSHQRMIMGPNNPTNSSLMKRSTIGGEGNPTPGGDAAVDGDEDTLDVEDIRQLNRNIYGFTTSIARTTTVHAVFQNQVMICLLIIVLLLLVLIWDAFRDHGPTLCAINKKSP